MKTSIYVVIFGQMYNEKTKTKEEDKMEYTLNNPKHLIDALKLYKSIDNVTLNCKNDSLYLHAMVMWSICSLEVEFKAPIVIGTQAGSKEFKLNLNVAETCVALDQAAKTKANKWILTADKRAANLVLRAYDRQNRMLNETSVKTVELSNSLILEDAGENVDDGNFKGIHRFPIEFRNMVKIPLDRLVQCMTNPAKANLFVTIDTNNVLKFGTSSTLSSSMQCVPLELETSTIGYAKYSETFGASIANLLKSTSGFMKTLVTSSKSKADSKKRSRGGLGGSSKKKLRVQVGLDDDEEEQKEHMDSDEEEESPAAAVEEEEMEGANNYATLWFDNALPMCIDFTTPGARVTLFAGSKQRDDESESESDDDNATDEDNAQ